MGARMLSPQTERSAVPLPGQKFKDCEACPELVLLPQGSFRMGAPDHEQDREVSEGPVHDVSIGYSAVMGRTEVTFGEFSLFAASSGYRTDAERGPGCASWVDGEWKKDKSRHWRNPGFAQTDAHPVTCISWNDAQAYVDWLNELASGKRFRLPSEAEWEYAARAGEGSQRFPWSNDAGHSDLCADANGADQTARLKLAMAATPNAVPCAAAPGTAIPRPCVRPSASATQPTTATAALVFGSCAPFDSCVCGVPGPGGPSVRVVMRDTWRQANAGIVQRSRGERRRVRRAAMPRRTDPHARIAPDLRTLRHRPAGRFPVRAHLQFRVHVLRRLRRHRAVQRLPQLRRWFRAAAGAPTPELEGWQHAGQAPCVQAEETQAGAARGARRAGGTGG
jgi:hypothetical protein